ncbi:glycosyltransferase family 4 protein [Alkalihalobacterium chitinilyticum]|uniref:Glycosyltransferase family 4 protein n=1 Tax=Alkalihalobacterium chitinilyticum TaxID=2980103 RepID=A0ABT5VE93_9BACI|nr:glycosyltransferase family 4 protein [Alkalihalobacterium chitinilyticum]MDE5413782.1 glycosyltransferase family 4 protein [Alkalihalobacterium chitinilyticum]
MPNKILFCATVDYHFKAFHLPYMKWFKEQGWEVHVAANGEVELPFTDQKYNIPIQRSPFKLQNVKAFNHLKAIINEHHYEIIHCHTPIGGVLARLAARKARKQGTEVLYTAHGFHFCQGAPTLNWFIYYPIEKQLANYTDCLITINQEDYELANSRKFKAGLIERVHGVGVDTNRYKPILETEKIERKKLFGYHPDDFLIFYAAEFNKNKNQQLLIRSLVLIQDYMPNAKLLLAGEGALQEHCRQLVKKLGIEHMVQFLGFRKDIDTLLPICDIAVGSSYREGLPVNILEAMACGLPIVASKNRGHVELVQDHVNGYLVSPNDYGKFARSLLRVYQNAKLRKQMGAASREMVEIYSLQQINLELSAIYNRYMLEETNETKSKYHHAGI